MLSQKGKEILFHNGYRYRKDRVTSVSESWRCTVKTCKGRLSRTGEQKNEKNSHNHAPNPALEETNKAQNAIKDLARNTPLPPRAIIQASVSEVKTEEAAVLFPSYEANRKAVKRAREKENLPNSVSGNLNDLKTSKGKPFLLWDSQDNDPNESRILLFGTEENINLMSEFQDWSVDGTFDVAPSLLFTQLFTVHIIVGKKAIPALFALLENKQAQTYFRLFTKIKDLGPNLNPKSILVDFEIACFSTIAKVFPEVDIAACFFHMTQCIWRKIQKLGLNEKYKTSENFRTNCKMLVALAFVPVKDVQFGLEIISENFEADLKPLVDYWERAYVGKRIENVEPIFSIKMWNVFDRIQKNLPTTNNSLEAWHLSFQKSLECHNPSLSKLCHQMIKEQASTEMFIVKYRTGFRPSIATHSKYFQKNLRIKNLLREYSFRNIAQHLRSIAYNLSL